MGLETDRGRVVDVLGRSSGETAEDKRLTDHTGTFVVLSSPWPHFDGPILDV